MPSIPPSLGRTSGPQAAPTAAPTPPVPGASLSPQPASAGGINIPRQPGVGQSPTDQLDEELHQYISRLMAPAPPGVGGDVGNGMRLEPPASPEEKEARRAGWRALFDKLAADPNAQQALMMAAMQIMQPVKPGSGENVLSRLIQGAVAGQQGYRQLEAQDREAELQENQLALQKRRLALEEAKAMEDEGWRTLTPEEVAQFGYPEGSVVQADANEQHRVLYEPPSELEQRRMEAEEERLGFERERLGLERTRVQQEDRRIAQTDERISLEERELLAELEDDDLWTTMSAKQKQEAGYPTGAVVQVGPDGKHRITYEGESDPDLREKRINATLMHIQQLRPDMDQAAAQQLATDIADGRTELLYSPELGEISVVDKVGAALGVEGAARVVPTTRPEPAPPPARPEGEGVFPQAEDATGPISALKAFIGRAPGADRVGLTDEEVEAARQDYRLLAHRIRQAFILNKRYPVAEQQTIDQITQVQPRVWDNPKALRDRVRNLRDELENYVAEAEWIANNETLSREKRMDARDTKADLQLILSDLQVPEPAEVEKGLQTLEGAKQMTDEEIAEWMRGKTDHEIRALPQEVLDYLDKRKEDQ